MHQRKKSIGSEDRNRDDEGRSLLTALNGFYHCIENALETSASDKCWGGNYFKLFNWREFCLFIVQKSVNQSANYFLLALINRPDEWRR